MDIKTKLFKVPQKKYGDFYLESYLEQYKIYLEMADRISSKRQSANSFFLSINTAIIALVGYIQLGPMASVNKFYYIIVSLAGMMICYSWYRLIHSYKDLNSGKFKVIHLIEQNLPIAPYDAEWELLEKGENSKIYLPFTKVEMTIPWVFFSVHFTVLILSLLYFVCS